MKKQGPGLLVMNRRLQGNLLVYLIYDDRILLELANDLNAAVIVHIGQVDGRAGIDREVREKNGVTVEEIGPLGLYVRYTYVDLVIDVKDPWAGIDPKVQGGFVAFNSEFIVIHDAQGLSGGIYTMVLDEV